LPIYLLLLLSLLFEILRFILIEELIIDSNWSWDSL